MRGFRAPTAEQPTAEQPTAEHKNKKLFGNFGFIIGCFAVGKVIRGFPQIAVSLFVFVRIDLNQVCHTQFIKMATHYVVISNGFEMNEILGVYETEDEAVAGMLYLQMKNMKWLLEDRRVELVKSLAAERRKANPTEDELMDVVAEELAKDFNCYDVPVGPALVRKILMTDVETLVGEGVDIHTLRWSGFCKVKKVINRWAPAPRGGIGKP